MKLENTLSIPVSVPDAWRVLLDIERIAPCVPGATLTERDGDRFKGKVKVKLGPIGLTYGGTVTFVSLDEEARVAVMEASGRETRGAGTAKATITCRLTGNGDTTDVLVETDLAITGKPAQFGRSVLADVSAGLIDQFAANLADELANDTTGAENTEASTTENAPAPPAPAPAAEPVDLLRATGGGLLRSAWRAVSSAVTALLSVFRRRRPTRAASPDHETR